MVVLYYLLAIAVGSYLLGAIPVGAIVAAVHNIDISQHGSGKTGTTNVLRTVGRRAAALVLLGDFLKGLLAVVLARLLAGVFLLDTVNVVGISLSGATLGSLIAAAGAMVGHVWSLYLRVLTGAWRGGRGVATAIGAVLAVSPWVILAAAIVGVPTIVITRYVSLGSILGAVGGGLGLILLVSLGQMDLLSILFLFIPVFIVLSHRDNIARILKGTERKLGERVKL